MLEEGCRKPVLDEKDVVNQCLRKDVVNQCLSKDVVNQCLRKDVVNQCLRKAVVNQCLRKDVVNQCLELAVITPRFCNRTTSVCRQPLTDHTQFSQAADSH